MHFTKNEYRNQHTTNKLICDSKTKIKIILLQLILMKWCRTTCSVHDFLFTFLCYFSHLSTLLLYFRWLEGNRSLSYPYLPLPLTLCLIQIILYVYLYYFLFHIISPSLSLYLSVYLSTIYWFIYLFFHFPLRAVAYRYSSSHMCSIFYR